jgi:hypothetical protein
VMSPRFPIGVATRYRPGTALGAVRIVPATENVRGSRSLSVLFMEAAFGRIMPI